jgi:hypothetical protein
MNGQLHASADLLPLIALSEPQDRRRHLTRSARNTPKPQNTLKIR